MTTAVTGVYFNRSAAESALRGLIAAGFPRDAISVILSRTPEHEKLILEETDDTSRGLVAGLIAGGAFASLAFGVLALPGVGVIAAGPVLAALTAGGAGAAAGGVLGAMVGHGLSTHTAQEYESAIQSGGVMLAVHTLHSRLREVRHLLEVSGATHVSDSVHFGRNHTEDEASV